MNRFLTGLTACLIVLAQAARAQSPSELSQTGAYAAAFQNADGGFAAKAGGPSTLGATSTSVRILKNTGGSIPDVLACIKYVKSCYNSELGGFAQTPGGKPDVATTASGLMAVAELKIPPAPIVEGASKFLTENAKSYEDVRIAIAGFEAIGGKTPEFARWTEEMQKGRNDDGTYGQGEGKALETGGKAAALLRMGVTLDKKDAITSYLKSAQRPDGAWSKDGGASDLSTTYRIMRALYMMKESPDLDRLAALIARCRHGNGGYGVQPGAEASPQGTYFATTVMRWVRLLGGEPAIVETAGFQPLFNGKDLSGWDGDTSLWSARDGVLVGTSTGLKNNDFLATNGSWENFVLKLTFKLVGGSGNSGVQFRSVRVPGHEMSGYQADLGENYWGCLYDESRRNRVLVQASPAALKSLRKDGWNRYTVSALGPDIRLALNNVTSVTYKETDPAIARDGRVAVQMHAGGPMQVLFKDIYIQPLPEPKEGPITSPGFHIRTLKLEKEERKYVVYTPQGYDGTKAFPVVLFLHGAGERGDDGVKQAQVGLGPAIFNNPGSFPAIAVLPQAKRTWAADSDDAKAALGALDEVLGALKVDRSRIAITGLSMGGAGSWSIAAAHPERFSAVVPICGRGKTETAATISSLPVWTIVGDADSDATVLNTRAMAEAIAAAGGKAKLTEYRDVGHNSWDRAYNNPMLIDWMLAQARK